MPQFTLCGQVIDDDDACAFKCRYCQKPLENKAGLGTHEKTCKARPAPAHPWSLKLRVADLCEGKAQSAGSLAGRAASADAQRKRRTGEGPCPSCSQPSRKIPISVAVLAHRLWHETSGRLVSCLCEARGSRSKRKSASGRGRSARWQRASVPGSSGFLVCPPLVFSYQCSLCLCTTLATSFSRLPTTQRIIKSSGR